MRIIDLSNKTAFITGASQGLGEVFARTLHSAGASVVVNFLDVDENGANAERLAEELGKNAIAVSGDVRDPSQVDCALGQSVTHFGSLDLIVNNAGILRDRTTVKMTHEEWQQVIDTNLTGVFNVCKSAAPRMANGGRIVNLSSLSAVTGPYGQANYAAAKGGVISLTKVLSREFAKRSINVNAVAPGVVLTEMGRSIPPNVAAQMLTQIPLRRFGEPQEIADVVLFLCSDLATYINGQTVHVNGGWWA